MDSTVMTISSDHYDAAMVLQSMTDLYAYKMLAPIREIPCNAADAHAEAGQTRPVEVRLPSLLHPQFVVQDWGTGLNWDDFVNIFAKFGRSTKRETNDQTGMLGFGCKSPLTYCLSFTVVGIKNGVKTVAVVSKGDNGIGEIKMLDEYQTDEPNGVTVTMPVAQKDIDQFNEQAIGFFRFWREGVLVNGEPPKVIEPILELDPDLWVIDSSNHTRQRSYIVQGNVPYPYDTPTGLPATVAWVDIGSVSFPPSREALQDDDRTKSALETVREVVQDRLSKVISYAVETTPNSYERWKRVLQLRASLPYGFKHKYLAWSHRELYFQDRKYGWHVDAGTAQRVDGIHAGWVYNHNRNRHTREVSYITGFDLKGVSSSHKERIRLAGIQEPYVIVPEDPGIHLDGFPGMKWKDVPPLPKRERASREREQRVLFREETKYSFYVHGTSSEEKLPTYTGDLPVLYVDNDGTLAWQLSKEFPVAVASIIVANQEDRFCRLHEGAQFWRPWVVAEIDRLVKRLTKKDHEYLDAPFWQRYVIQYLGDRCRQVKDPDLRRRLNLKRSEHLDALIHVHKNFMSRNVFGSQDYDLVRKVHGVQVTPYRLSWPDDLLKSYPLLFQFDEHRVLDHAPVDDLLIYLNARYRENKKKNDTTAQAA